MEATLENAAMLIGTSVNRLEGFPEETKESMLAALEFLNTDTEDNAVFAIETMRAIWEEGVTILDLKQIAAEVGVSAEALLRYEIKDRKRLIFHYYKDMENGSTKKAHDSIRAALDNVPTEDLDE